jgi:hypothetical protein
MGQHRHQSTRIMLNAIFNKYKTYILNIGKNPNFVICNRKEVIDFTLESNKTRGLVSIWYVSVISVSHYKYISFQVGNLVATTVTYQDSKTANLES